MPTIRKHADYITMINYFRVEPDDQVELMRIQMEDIDLFGRKQPAMRAASFHRSLDGDRVFNYAHWASLEGLAAWRASDDMKAHMKRMESFRFQVDPHPYQVVAVSTNTAAPQVVPGRQPQPVLSYYSMPAEHQQAVVDVLLPLVESLDGSTAGHVASWLARSRDGVRVALYSQWRTVEDHARYADSPSVKDVAGRLAGLISDVETKAYEVGSVGYKADAQ